MWNTTFKAPTGNPAHSRRSPEPPTAFVEPLSPFKPEPIEPSFNYPAVNTANAYNHRAQNGSSGTPKARAYSLGQGVQKKGHRRTISDIDALANAALNVAPTFVSPAPRKSSVAGERTKGQSRAHPNYNQYGSNGEPPHKRAKSEFVSFPHPGHQPSRPATSYTGHEWKGNNQQSIPGYDRRVEEAALLLNFSTTGGWPSTSPDLRHAIPAAVRPHSNSFPQDARHQRPGDQIAQDTFLPPLDHLSTTGLPPPTLPSPQRTSDGAGPSPEATNERVPEDVVMTDAASPMADEIKEERPPPQQTQTPPEEPGSRAPSSDVVMTNGPEAPKKRGWPKGKSRVPGVKRATADKTASRRPAVRKKSPDTTNNKSGLEEVAAGLRDRQQASRRGSFHGVPSSLERAETDARDRSRSVPRAIHMVILGDPVSKPARKAKTTKETVCAFCESSRETSNAAGELDEWISCNGCKKWFHLDCAGFKKAHDVRDVDKYFCAVCEPTHGQTTYVRKSRRAHTNVDYAELQRGVLKTSEDSNEHHYIKPIKDGTFEFDTELFPRMRPELVTKEFLEKSGAFVEPICIPGAWNPRPWERRQRENLDGSTEDDTRDEECNFNDFMFNDYEYDMEQDDGQDKLDMVMPEDLTVRQVCNLVGADTPLDVIDVKTQNSGAKWNLGKWADYYEETSEEKAIRNVISLEVSQTKLGRLLRRPQVVRDIDLQDAVWPKEEIDKGKFPKVQFYCLMSIADSYTDFHIDFGGSSVYYHILKGKKTFFFIPPKPKYLKAYEEWNDSPQQNFTFLGHITKECYRVDLSEGDTMLIPSGWIHAVWTPETSLVIGGNFLTRMSYKNQFRVVEIERNNGTPQKFRYPHFQRIMWYTAIGYLESDPLPPAVSQLFYEGKQFERVLPIWQDFDGQIAEDDTRPGASNARYYSQAEIDGLPELVNFIFRTVMLVMGRIEGVTADRIKRVNASIPKGHGEPLEVAKTFALWVAWKRGNEDPPAWAHPDAVLPNSKDEAAPKKLSARALKDMERKEAIAAWRLAPDRQSKRMMDKAAAVAKAPVAPAAKPSVDPVSAGFSVDATSNSSNTNFIVGPSCGQPLPPAESSPPSTHMQISPQLQQTPSYASPQMFAASPNGAAMTMMNAFGQYVSTPKTSVLGPKRVACDACRKRRIRCKHKDLVVQAPSSAQPSPNGSMPANGLASHVATEFGDSINVSPYAQDNGQNPFYGMGIDGQHVNGAHDSPGGPDGVDGESHFDGHQGPLPGTNAYINANIPMTMNGVPMFGEIPKRGRSKACYECRKSKRRCIHDESGNVDPVKAAETPVPRGSVASKKRQGEDGSPAPPAKKLKTTATPTPGPPPMQGLHGVLRPVSTHQAPKQAKASPSGDSWSNGIPHGLPQYDDRLHDNGNGIQQHQQHNDFQQHNQSAPPIDPSLMASMYPEPAHSHPYGGSAYPYPSNERPSMYNLPSLEQIATEVLDMDGRGQENYESGLAAIEQFNRQREENIQMFQAQQDLPHADASNDSMPLLSQLGQNDGSVDSAVALPAHADKPSTTSPSEVTGEDASILQHSQIAPAQDDIVIHHELPPALDPSAGTTSHAEESSAQLPSATSNAEPNPTSPVEESKAAARRSSFASIPVYKPPAPPARSPEVSRKDLPKGSTSPSISAKSPTTPSRRKRDSFSAGASAKKAAREPSMPALEEEEDDVRLAKSLHQEELGLRRRGA